LKERIAQLEHDLSNEKALKDQANYHKTQRGQTIEELRKDNIELQKEIQRQEDMRRDVLEEWKQEREVLVSALQSFVQAQEAKRSAANTNVDIAKAVALLVKAEEQAVDVLSKVNEIDGL
jgi:membrane protein involved in colicin uptake